MKRWLCSGVLVGLSALSSSAFAQTPPARVGFQLGMRTGFAVPTGEISKGRKMSDAFAGQVPFVVDVGAKPIPALFLGGYLGLNFGGAAGSSRSACDALDATCLGATFRVGLELAYHFLPAGSVNPWLGYGIGVESSGVSGAHGGDRISESYAGWELAHLMGGLDFRVNRGFGVGPFIDFSVGTYTRQQFTQSGQLDIKSDIADTASHQWLTFGVRFVLFP
jgi:hypothetical protein